MHDTITIRETLHAAYQRDSWLALLQSLFTEGSLELFLSAQPLLAIHENVKETLQLGKVTLPGDEEPVAILEVQTSDQVK